MVNMEASSIKEVKGQPMGFLEFLDEAALQPPEPINKEAKKTVVGLCSKGFTEELQPHHNQSKKEKEKEKDKDKDDKEAEREDRRPVIVESFDVSV